VFLRYSIRLSAIDTDSNLCSDVVVTFSSVAFVYDVVVVAMKEITVEVSRMLYCWFATLLL